MPSFATTLVSASDVVRVCRNTGVYSHIIVLYLGHGGKLQDDNGDEKDGYDETLVPLDYETAGQIRDDDLYKTLICGLKEGVFATMVMDCCHSGSVLDLPFSVVADGKSSQMGMNQDFNFGRLLAMAEAYMAAKKAGTDPIAAVLNVLGGPINSMFGPISSMASAFMGAKKSGDDPFSSMASAFMGAQKSGDIPFSAILARCGACTSA